MIRALVLLASLSMGAQAAHLDFNDSSVSFTRNHSGVITTEYCEKRKCVRSTFTSHDFSLTLDAASDFIESVYYDNQFFADYISEHVSNIEGEKEVNIAGVMSINVTKENAGSLIANQKSIERGLFAFYRAIHSEPLMEQFKERLYSDEKVAVDGREFLLYKTLSKIMINRGNNV